MEDSITIEELYILAESLHRAEHRRNKFAAALKGINIDEGMGSKKFEELQQKANAELSGKSEENLVFDMIGIEYDADDD